MAEFQGYTALDLAAVTKLQTAIPEKTSISGKLILLYEKVDTTTGTIPRITFILNVITPVSGARSDYVASSNQRATARKVRIDVCPGQDVVGQGEEECSRVLTEAWKRLKRGALKNLRVSVGGGRYNGSQAIPGEGEKLVPMIECVGNRQVQIGDSDSFTLVLDAASQSMSSIEPAWFSSPRATSPLPTRPTTTLAPFPPSQPIPPPRAASKTQWPALPSSTAGPSSKRLQPITSHKPSLGSFPSDNSSNGAMNKRRPSIGSRPEPATQAKKQRTGSGDAQLPLEQARSRPGSGASAAGSIAEPLRRRDSRDQYSVEPAYPPARETSADVRETSRPVRSASASVNIPQSRTPAPAALPKSPSVPSTPNNPLQAAQPIVSASEASGSASAPVAPAKSAQELRKEAQLASEARRKAVIAEAARTARFPLPSAAPVQLPAVTYLGQPGGNPSAKFGAPGPRSAVLDTPQTVFNQSGSSFPGYQTYAASTTPSTTYQQPSGSSAVQIRGPASEAAPFMQVAQILAGLAPNTASVNVVGIVWRKETPRQPKDWSFTIILTDQSVTGDQRYADHLSVTLFRKSHEEFPIVSQGTPILLRGLTMNRWKGKIRMQDASKAPASWAYLLNGEVVYSRPTDPRLSSDEMNKLLAIAAWYKPNAGDGPAPFDPRALEKPYRLLKDIRAAEFSKIAFKIIKVIDRREHVHRTDGKQQLAVELYITDGSLMPGRPWGSDHYDFGLPPSSIVRLAIFTPPTEHEMQQYYRVGTYLSLSNVRSEKYQDALQLVWNDAISDEQEAMGWRRKQATLLAAEDPRAIEVEKRFQALLTGAPPRSEAPNPSQSHTANLAAGTVIARPVAPVNYSSAPPMVPGPIVPHSNQLVTTFKDPELHGLTALVEIHENQTVPNRYKVRARVAQIYAVGKRKEAYVTKYCANTKCLRGFGVDKSKKQLLSCQSCNNHQLEHGELRYRFLVLLTTSPILPLPTDPDDPTPHDSETFLPVLFSDEDAAKILPPLPPLGSSINQDPKRETDLNKRLDSDKQQVLELLMGNLMDGKRTHPTADWCIESYLARPPQGKGAPPGEAVVMYRMFGMEYVPAARAVGELAKGLD